MTTGILAFVLRFYVPLILSVLLLGLCVGLRPLLGERAESRIDAEFHLSLIVVAIPVRLKMERATLLRAGLLTGAIVSAFGGLSTNFAGFFPQELRMDVYFDVSGIAATLASFPRPPVDSLHIPPDWEHLTTAFDAQVRRRLRSAWNASKRPNGPSVAEIDRNLIHANGSTTFVVSRLGPLSYHIDSSDGELSYRLDVPRRVAKGFRTTFHLHPTAADHLRPSFLQLLLSPKIVIKPEFKEVYNPDEAADVPYDSIIIGMTEVTLLPFPAFSNSVYLWRDAAGRLIPVAYTVYSVK